MKQGIYDAIRASIDTAVRVAAQTSPGRYFLEQAVNITMKRTWSIRHRGVELAFAVPNNMNYFRIDTFATKEPETLDWIDSIPEGSVVWDIGANVGLYTCYAAKARECRVIAFEPSVFNLELLARNIFLNGLTSQVTIFPLPLSEALATSTLNMSSVEWGGALSTFAQAYSHDGQPLHKIFEVPTIGISMDEAVALLRIPAPDYIKLDVDGIEHLILKGGAGVLRLVRGVLVEINEEFEKQVVEAARYLGEAGLVFKEKRHAELFDDTIYRNSYNQIWCRS